MIYTYLFIITLILNFFLGLFVLAKDFRNQINISFALFVISVVLWMTANFLSNNTADYNQALLYNKLIFLFSPYMSFSLLYFSFVFPKPIKNYQLRNLVYVLIPVVLSNILTATNLVITDITFLSDGGTGVLFGPGIYFFGIQLIAYFIISTGILIKKYRSTIGQEKTQLQYLLLGFSILTVFGTITNFLVPLLLSSFSSTDIGPLLTLAIFGFTAYAILRHKLLNIKVIATQVLVVLLWILLLAKIFISQSPNDFIVNIVLFSLLLLFGLLLIKSVTREVSQREELEDLNDKLKELDVRKNEFINMAAHELRAPMTAIKGYISMLIEGDAGEIPEKARGFLTDAQGVTERLIRLVNNMLNVSRIEENRMVFQVENVHLAEVARTVFSEFRGEAVRKNLQFDLDIPSEVKDLVTVDSDRIHEVVANFLSNSIKYTEQGFVKLTLSQTDDRHIRVSVSDSGLGISPEEQKKLFQKFSRAESAVGKTVGTGLGLYITKLLVEKFGGTIGLTSESGKGSTFWFELPIVNS